MQSKSQELINYLRDSKGIARFSDILKAGFHSDSLALLEKSGKIEKIGRGLYRLDGYATGSHPDLVEASQQAPRGVICLLSALAFHEATNEIPRYVEMAIPLGARAGRIQYPPVKFYRFAPAAWEAGIVQYEIEGHVIKIYSLAKTIADCFKFRNRIGANVARDALKTAITDMHVQPKEIMKYAKVCRVDSIIKPILEALI
ncbi:MAG: type IV toxin-antitoxin system AbiEi family antitoxin domain-containing protein [Deltaproteobacteria bacterium]